MTTLQSANGTERIKLIISVDTWLAVDKLDRLLPDLGTFETEGEALRSLEDAGWTETRGTA